MLLSHQVASITHPARTQGEQIPAANLGDISWSSHSRRKVRLWKLPRLAQGPVLSQICTRSSLGPSLTPCSCLSLPGTNLASAPRLPSMPGELASSGALDVPFHQEEEEGSLSLRSPDGANEPLKPPFPEPFLHSSRNPATQQRATHSHTQSSDFGAMFTVIS